MHRSLQRCQGWGRGFESLRPLQSLRREIRALCMDNVFIERLWRSRKTVPLRGATSLHVGLYKAIHGAIEGFRSGQRVRVRVQLERPMLLSAARRRAPSAFDRAIADRLR